MCRSKIFFGGAFSSYLRALSSSSKAPSYCVSAFLHCLYSFVQSLYSLGIIVLLFYHRCTITVTIYHKCIEVVLFYCTVYIALFIHNTVIIICVQFVYHQCNIQLLLAFQCTFIQHRTEQYFNHYCISTLLYSEHYTTVVTSMCDLQHLWLGTERRVVLTCILQSVEQFVQCRAECACRADGFNSIRSAAAALLCNHTFDTLPSLPHCSPLQTCTPKYTFTNL